MGFCGYASISAGKAAAFAVRTLLRNAASTLGLSSDEPQSVYPPVLLRQRVLDLLRRDPNMECDFIQRTKYKAGVKTPEQETETRREFFANIRNTDYTVCVRGGGNFSVRLYETLAMGRIPVLVDTDCLLPFNSDPRWRECCVYIHEDELPHIAEKVQAFHNALSEDAFLDVQYQARHFWEERLSFNGFFTHFPTHFGVANEFCRHPRQ